MTPTANFPTHVALPRIVHVVQTHVQAEHGAVSEGNQTVPAHKRKCALQDRNSLLQTGRLFNGGFNGSDSLGWRLLFDLDDDFVVGWLFFRFFEAQFWLGGAGAGGGGTLWSWRLLHHKGGLGLRGGGGEGWRGLGRPRDGGGGSEAAQEVRVVVGDTFHHALQALHAVGLQAELLLMRVGQHVHRHGVQTRQGLGADAAGEAGGGGAARGGSSHGRHSVGHAGAAAAGRGGDAGDRRGAVVREGRGRGDCGRRSWCSAAARAVAPHAVQHVHGKGVPVVEERLAVRTHELTAAGSRTEPGETAADDGRGSGRAEIAGRLRCGRVRSVTAASTAAPPHEEGEGQGAVRGDLERRRRAL